MGTDSLGSSLGAVGTMMISRQKSCQWLAEGMKFKAQPGLAPVQSPRLRVLCGCRAGLGETRPSP